MTKKKTPPIKTHVLIDTNILIKVCTQSKSGFEFDLWEKFTKLVDQGKIILIVPEVIQFEFETFARSAESDFHQSVEHFAKFVFKKPHWNELDQLKSHLGGLALQWKDEFWKEWEERIQKVLKWMTESKKSIHIPLLDAMVSLKKRQITKRMPPKRDGEDDQEKRDHDLLILESAVISFKKEIKHAQLLVCTENAKHFGPDTDKDEERVVHLKFGEDFPPNRMFLDLASLMKFIGDDARVVPLTPEQIDEIEEEQINDSVAAEIHNEQLYKTLAEYANYVSRKSFLTEQERTSLAAHFEERRRAGEMLSAPLREMKAISEMLTAPLRAQNLAIQQLMEKISPVVAAATGMDHLNDPQKINPTISHEDSDPNSPK